MDKHQVRININGKNKTYSKGKKKRQKERQPASEENIPVQEESREDDLPIIIIDESAAAAEKKEEEFEWVLPKGISEQKEESEPITPYIEDLRNLKKEKGEKTQKSPFGKKKKLAPPSFSKQLILSIGMAIGIGTCLGFLILAVMNMTNPLNPDVPAQATVAPTNNENTGDSAVSGTGSITLPGQSIAVLQAGAFSTMDGANAEIARLQTAGFSATAVGSDPIYVLMAIGQTVDGMKQIAGLAQGKGFEPYAKDLAIGEKTVGSLTDQDLIVLQEGQALYKQLAIATSVLLQGSSLDSAATQTLEASYAKVAGVEDSSLSEATKEWKTSLVSAYANLQEYQGSSNAQLLWDAQQRLLDATAFLY